MADTTNHGTNWHHLMGLGENDIQYVSVNAVFARHKRFRIELYIDLTIKPLTPYIFKTNQM